MATTEQAPATEGKRRRKASGPRQAKPIFIAVSYRDEAGNPQPLDRHRMTIEAFRDAAELLGRFERDPSLAYATVEIPSATKAPSAAAS